MIFPFKIIYGVCGAFRQYVTDNFACGLQWLPHSLSFNTSYSPTILVALDILDSNNAIPYYTVE